jgi:hypothetical protein
LILIFVRRDCVAGKIGMECCKHLTVERKKRNVRRASRSSKANSPGVEEDMAAGLAAPVWRPETRAPQSSHRRIADLIDAI